jgi:exopolyphosphatase/guanosine-5'-triphosphate,3'-diphosphate pyrophosphatase
MRSLLDVLRPTQTAARAPIANDALRAIIDIGSNTIRLIIYSGPPRMPVPVLNEKVSAGLARTLSFDGQLDQKAVRSALAGLKRFALLVKLMGVEDVRTVATAAVRDASNGPEFLDTVRGFGLEPELFSGEQEAIASALGVFSAFPQAHGIVGDLGGGSLELVELDHGRVGRRDSFPLGTLRLPTIRGSGAGALDRYVGDLLRVRGWNGAAAGRPFYLVGGSWRALARVDMHETGYPAGSAHGYEMPPIAADEHARAIAIADPRSLREVPNLPNARIPMLADAASLLAIVVRALAPETLIVSAFGLREGLLYERLDADQRLLDPLVVAARYHGERDGAAPGHGDLLAGWIAPIFASDPPGDARLREAACLIAVGTGLDRGLRPKRALEVMLDEDWVAVDARDRSMIAQALATSFGTKGSPATLSLLAPLDDLHRAARWGQAIRFGRRLSGAAPQPLGGSALALEGGRLRLELDAGLAALYTEGAERHHRTLAASFSAEAELVIR